jgi:exonuclease III
MERIKIATLNIAAASKERARKVLDEWVVPNSCDVYVFTETSEGEGTQLISTDFKTAGWSVYQRATEPKDRGVMIATRLVSKAGCRYPEGDPAPGRSLIIRLSTDPSIEIVGMYVPNRGNDPTKAHRKKAFLDCWLHWFTSNTPSREHRILVGDLNVVPPDQHPQFLPQQLFEYSWFEEIQRKGQMYDAAERHHETRHESTWVAHTGEGYTYDHILIQNSIQGRVERFEYDHGTRLAGGVSDHSALVLTVELNNADFIHRRELVVPTQTSLFDF